MNDGSVMRALLSLLTRCAAYGGALFLVAMMLITVADVILRAALNLPITGAYDLVQLFLVGTVFLSIPDVFLRGENIAVDFVDHVFGPSVVGALKVIANVFALIFISVLCWRMFPPAGDAVKFHEVSPDLSVPMIVHWALMIAGIVVTLPAAAFMLVLSVQALLRGRAG
jgi:TRAP-type transport system small permease protein